LRLPTPLVDSDQPSFSDAMLNFDAEGARNQGFREFVASELSFASKFAMKRIARHVVLGLGLRNGLIRTNEWR
jgi:hypothetical protein